MRWRLEQRCAPARLRGCGWSIPWSARKISTPDHGRRLSSSTSVATDGHRSN